ncbi:MAG: sensor histidine kinase [Jatrophihabitans sp.]|nr:MAG: sensor histidine kinase [Jatrophihabitans sp.]
MPAFLVALFTRRAWAELLYALVSLPVGIAGFTFTVVTLSVSGGLLVTFVGLPLIASSGFVSRWVGGQWRATANALLGWGVPAPAPFRARPGFLGWLGSCLKDGTAWRARAYLLLKLPLGIASFVAAVAFYAYGLGGMTYWIWRPFLPCNTDAAGRCHRAAQLWNGEFIDTPGRIALVAALGLLFTLAAPWVVRGVLQADRALVHALLGPTWTSARVAELEQSRAAAVDDSAATLRRIERDLHDGTQARLVALAMNVGLAKEKLTEGADPAEAAALLDSAHATAKQAIAEVRDLARGIHPPVLDAGLDAALATLVAHSAVPVSVHTDLPVRPDPAVETIAYFCAAELITNVAKHSGATGAVLDVTGNATRLALRVSDNGSGGARIGAGSGLAGLAERVRAVDGSLSVDSPAGGPTSVCVTLPVHHGERR